MQFIKNDAKIFAILLVSIIFRLISLIKVSYNDIMCDYTWKCMYPFATSVEPTLWGKYFGGNGFVFVLKWSSTFFKLLYYYTFEFTKQLTSQSNIWKIVSVQRDVLVLFLEERTQISQKNISAVSKLSMNCLPRIYFRKDRFMWTVTEHRSRSKISKSIAVIEF